MNKYYKLYKYTKYKNVYQEIKKNNTDIDHRNSAYYIHINIIHLKHIVR